MRRAGLDNQLAHPIRHSVNIIDIEVKTEGIIFDILGPASDFIQVQVPTAPVGKDAVVAIIALHHKAEPFVKRLAGIEIAAWDDGDDVVFPYDAVHVDFMLGMAA